MSTPYLETVARLEPDIDMIDPGAFYASAAISLKRIADSLEVLNKALGEMNAGFHPLAKAFIDSLAGVDGFGL